MVTTNKLNEVKMLRRAPSNNRKMRFRPEETHKNCAIHLVSEKKEDGFAKDIGEFGKNWAKKYKGDEYGLATPTLNEMTEGLMQWLTR